MAELAHGKPGAGTAPLADHSATTRRDFLTVAGTAIAAVGAVCVAWPILDSMNPAADVLAAGAPIDIDLSRVQPGQQIVVLWRSRPIFVVNRTPELLKTLQDPKDISLLIDPNSTAQQQPEYAAGLAVTSARAMARATICPAASIAAYPRPTICRCRPIVS
jgi:ubiquinol-cytochrome c reductase iron-sulfur subunit